MLDDKTATRIWNKLTGYDAWDVAIFHNFWDGSMYCSGVRPFRIYAQSAAAAVEYARNNTDVVEEYFRSKRVSRSGNKTIRLIRRGETYRIDPNRITHADRSYLLSGPLLTTDGTTINYRRDEHI